MFQLATDNTKLPQAPAIFFLSKRGKLLYIGASDNLQLRLTLPFRFDYQLVHWLPWNDKKLYLELRKAFQPPHNDGFKTANEKPYHIWMALDHTQSRVMMRIREKVTQLAKQSNSLNVDVSAPAIDEIIKLMKLAPFAFENELYYWYKKQQHLAASSLIGAC